MFRLSGLLCLAMSVVMGALLFQTSQSVQRAEQDLAEARDQAASEKDSLRVLTAEWDYLNRPERLEKLTLQNLDMDEVRAEKATFIEAHNAVPEPEMPAIPLRKPKNLLQYVSVEAQEKTDTDAPVRAEAIQNSESEKFDDLISPDASSSAASANSVGVAE